MKVLLAAHHCPPNYQGGVEWVTLHGAQWLQNHGNQVEIAAVEEIRELPEGEVTSREDEYQGIRIQRLCIPASSPADRFAESYWNEAIERWFYGHLQKTRPDILHLHSGYLLTLSVLHAAAQLGIATVLSLHDYWTVCPRINLLHPNGERCPGPEKNRCAWCLMTEKRRYRLPETVFGKGIQPFMKIPAISRLTGFNEVASQVQERSERMVGQIQQVDVIMALSRLTQELILKQGIKPEKVKLIPNGLDTSSWKKPLPEKKTSNKLRVGYLGNLIPIKGAHVLVEAFRKVRFEGRELELRVYGDINKTPGYDGQLRWLAGGDERIHFLGSYENHQIPEIFREIDVLVVPSLWNEIGPLVTMESFACLTPVIVSNIPNMVNQISEGADGLSFEAGNPQSLAKVLQRLVEEPGLLAHLTYGIRPIRSHEDQMTEWLRAYQTALEAHS